MTVLFSWSIQAVEKVLKIGTKYPMELQVDVLKECICAPDNETLYPSMNSSDWSHVSEQDCHSVSNQDKFHITLPVVKWCRCLAFFWEFPNSDYEFRANRSDLHSKKTYLFHRYTMGQ